MKSKPLRCPISHPLTCAALVALAAAVLPCGVRAQTVESRALTDKIYRGEGVINLMNNISGSQLAKYFGQTGNMLLLGVDVNEDASGNESSKSVGVAIKDAQLKLTTTAGDFTFKDFLTSTTAVLRETGSSTPGTYYTMFGQGGSSQITGSSTFDISRYDDVMWFDNINFTGDILAATLSVKFLDTPPSKSSPNASEQFFDFSGGFEDFALFNVADSVLIENANLGVAAAPTGTTFATAPSVTTVIEQNFASGGASTGDAGGSAGTGDIAGGTGTATGGSSVPGETTDTTGGGIAGGAGDIVTPPAAPAPPVVIVGIMAALLLWKQRSFLLPKNA